VDEKRRVAGLPQQQQPQVLQKSIESEDVSKDTVVWKVCTDGEFSVSFWKFSGNFQWTHNPSCKP